HAKEFPVLSVIARDVLAIPGVSIAIERLFSSCRHTLTDARSSMLAETASTTIVTKEWLKRGLGDDIAYLEDVTIHE
ncbi:Ac-type transposase, partial [Trametes versicolor FP-101664 SS1]|uniref:Ac-type transposase n=1 Tax=Trametes versicolor (strain FP-101664) TaxID=717944 RepID=UPI0004624127